MDLAEFFMIVLFWICSFKNISNLIKAAKRTLSKKDIIISLNLNIIFLGFFPSLMGLIEFPQNLMSLILILILFNVFLLPHVIENFDIVSFGGESK